MSPGREWTNEEHNIFVRVWLDHNARGCPGLWTGAGKLLASELKKSGFRRSRAACERYLKEETEFAESLKAASGSPWNDKEDEILVRITTRQLELEATDPDEEIPFDTLWERVSDELKKNNFTRSIEMCSAYWANHKKNPVLAGGDWISDDEQEVRGGAQNSGNEGQDLDEEITKKAHSPVAKRTAKPAPLKWTKDEEQNMVQLYRAQLEYEDLYFAEPMSAADRAKEIAERHSLKGYRRTWQAIRKKWHEYEQLHGHSMGDEGDRGDASLSVGQEIKAGEQGNPSPSKRPLNAAFRQSAGHSNESKAKTFRYNIQQRASLEKEILVNGAHPTQQRKIYLASKLKMEQAKITYWFDTYCGPYKKPDHGRRDSVSSAFTVPDPSQGSSTSSPGSGTHRRNRESLELSDIEPGSPLQAELNGRHHQNKSARLDGKHSPSKAQGAAGTYDTETPEQHDDDDDEEPALNTPTNRQSMGPRIPVSPQASTAASFGPARASNTQHTPTPDIPAPTNSSLRRSHRSAPPRRFGFHLHNSSVTPDDSHLAENESLDQEQQVVKRTDRTERPESTLPAQKPNPHGVPSVKSVMRNEIQRLGTIMEVVSARIFTKKQTVQNIDEKLDICRRELGQSLEAEEKDIARLEQLVRDTKDRYKRDRERLSGEKDVLEAEAQSLKLDEREFEMAKKAAMAAKEFLDNCNALEGFE